MHYNTLDASENVEIPLNDVRIEIYHRNNFKNFRSIFILTKYNWKDLVLFMFKDNLKISVSRYFKRYFSE